MPPPFVLYVGKVHLSTSASVEAFVAENQESQAANPGAESEIAGGLQGKQIRLPKIEGRGRFPTVGGSGGIRVSGFSEQH